ncbi:MAG TPA: transcription termination factor NusA [bacterium]|nr:transcription termination factor NusA [bacterium]
MKSELLALLNYWEKEKGIDRSFLISALENGLLTVYRKKAGLDNSISIKIDPESGEMLFLNEEGQHIEPPIFQWQRIAAQTARQVIIQKLREAEKNTIYHEFTRIEGTIVSGKVERFEDNNIVILLNKTEALLPYHHRLYNDHFKRGDYIKAYLLEVRKPNKGFYQLIVSRTHPDFVERLIEMEVPEIHEGIISIKATARFPGDLTKIAVYSSEKNVDPIGTCIGDKAIRIKNITKELNGEKIEIVLWNEKPEKYIANSLNPASCKKVILHEPKRIASVIVDDSQIFLAIGKKGQNVRLASKLTGWDIRVFRETEFEGDKRPATTAIKDIDEKTAVELAKYGFSSIKSIAEADAAELVKVPAIDEKKAGELIEKAKKHMEKQVQTKGENESISDSEKA